MDQVPGPVEDVLLEPAGIRGVHIGGELGADAPVARAVESARESIRSSAARSRRGRERRGRTERVAVLTVFI